MPAHNKKRRLKRKTISESDYSDVEEEIIHEVLSKDGHKRDKVSKVRAEDGHRRDKISKVRAEDGQRDKVSKARAEDGRRRKISRVRAEDVHWRDNEDNRSRSRSALIANLIATKSVLLERERASEEVMERAIEVALLNERNTILKSRLRNEKKACFDKQLTNDNLSYLNDIF